MMKMVLGISRFTLLTIKDLVRIITNSRVMVKLQTENHKV